MPARRRFEFEPDLLTDQERAYGRERLAAIKQQLSTSTEPKATSRPQDDASFLDSPDRIPEE